MNYWITSDTHFGHKSIIKHCNRPFANADEMDAIMLDNINRLVKPDDVLYHLGDFAWKSKSRMATQNYRNAIKCKNVHLIWGNHDKYIMRDSEFKAMFSSVGHYLDVNVRGQQIILTHYAFKVWDRSHRGSWHLYGHSHGSLPDDPNSLSFDVGVDCWDFHPVSFECVQEVMSKKTFVPLDHHGQREFENIP